jgi:Interferon-induced transmembrane protein
MISTEPLTANGTVNAAGGYGPPGGGGYGGPPPGAPPGGGYGGPPPGGGYGGPPPGGGYGGPPPGGGFGPPPGGYGFGPPGGGFPPPGGPMMPGMGGDVNTTLPLVLNIIGTLLCCGFGTIPAIIGLVFAIQAGNAKKTGDLETARGKAKTSLILAIVAYVLGIVGGGVGAILQNS